MGGIFYSVYFSFLAAVYISRFAYFASTTLNPDAQSWIFVSLVAACALYGALMGIEGLSRFAGFAFFCWQARWCWRWASALTVMRKSIFIPLYQTVRGRF